MDFSKFDPRVDGSYEIADAIKQSDYLTNVERRRLLAVIDAWGEELARPDETLEQARADLLRRLNVALSAEVR